MRRRPQISEWISWKGLEVFKVDRGKWNWWALPYWQAEQNSCIDLETLRCILVKTLFKILLCGWPRQSCHSFTMLEWLHLELDMLKRFTLVQVESCSSTRLEVTQPRGTLETGLKCIGELLFCKIPKQS